MTTCNAVYPHAPSTHCALPVTHDGPHVTRDGRGWHESPDYADGGVTTTDAFTEATSARAWPAGSEYAGDGVGGRTDLSDAYTDGFEDGAQWARDHLAAQEPTEAEVLAALNAQGVIVSPKMRPAPSLDYWGDKPAEAMRAALSAARAARRDEEKR